MGRRRRKRRACVLELPLDAKDFRLHGFAWLHREPEGVGALDQQLGKDSLGAFLMRVLRARRIRIELDSEAIQIRPELCEYIVKRFERRDEMA